MYDKKNNNNKSSNNQEDAFSIKKVKPRYVNITEDIFLSLTPNSLKLYLAFRFDADYSSKKSSVEKKIQFLINKTNISRTQVFYSLKELEGLGLLLRKQNKGNQSTYWVAQDLNYFNNSTSDPVQNMNDPVQNMNDIINNSFTNLYNKRSTSDLDKSPTVDQEVIDVYNEMLPEMPRVKFVTKDITSLVNKLIEAFPELSGGNEFSIESLKRYFNGIRELAPFFLVPYETKHGNKRRSNLKTLIRVETIKKFYNGEYSE